MKDLIVGDKATVARLAARLKVANSRVEYQRIQCVLIRATLGSAASEIAQLLGWSTATVHVMHSRWAKEGDAVFDVRARAAAGATNTSMSSRSGNFWRRSSSAPTLAACSAWAKSSRPTRSARDGRLRRRRSIACWIAMAGAR